MRDGLIGILAMLWLLLIAIAAAYKIGYDDGIVHVIEDTQITQHNEILTFNLDGGEWIYILERR